MRNSRRVVITGLGVVAPNGIGKDAFWQNLIAGKSAVDYITTFDTSPYPCKVGAEVRDFKPEEFMSRQRAKDLWRFSQFAVAAARMALDDARFEVAPDNHQAVGACFGTCLNGFERLEPLSDTFNEGGYHAIPPLTGFQYSTHAAVSHVAIEFGIQGPSMTLASGCSTGLDVIKWGYDQIQAGTARAVIAGGTETPLANWVYATFCAMGILTSNPDPASACRPYDLHRDGLVLGEGAGAVFIESLEDAEDRGVQIYAEITGFGNANEALHLRKVDPSGSTLTQAIHLALANSEIAPEDIDYISGHGNSMREIDRSETNGFKGALGRRAYSIPVSSIKSMIGQPVAASGILQAISTALTLRYGIIPPTVNYTTPDPDCDLDYVPNRSRVSRVNAALINAHAVGGTNSVLVLRKPPV